MFIWDRCYRHANGYGPLESNADKYEPLLITSECRSVDSSTIYFRCKVFCGFDHKSGWTNKRDENQRPLERCVREPIVPQIICNMQYDQNQQWATTWEACSREPIVAPPLQRLTPRPAVVSCTSGGRPKYYFHTPDNFLFFLPAWSQGDRRGKTKALLKWPFFGTPRSAVPSCKREGGRQTKVS